MQPGDQHRGDGGGGGVGRAGLIRGVLVIVTAVAIGAFVLSGLDDDRSAVVAAGEEVSVGDDTATTSSSLDSADDGQVLDPAGAEVTTETTALATEGSPTDSTTTTTDMSGAGVDAASEVMVLVLNAAGSKGVAGRGSEVLQAVGYQVLAPKNANVLGPSQVLYTEGYEEEAAEVAAAFGVDPVSVVAPLDPNNLPINDTQNANVVVVVGNDGLIDV